MKLSRNFTNKFNWILDNLIPPVIRDSKFFSYPLFWLLFGKKAKLFLNFKKNAWCFDEQEMADYYKQLTSVHIKRETDLNTKCIDFILSNLKGKRILDIACGRGYLANTINKHGDFEITGIDFVIPKKLSNNINPKFEEGIIENIKYPNNYFDTVISTHTLEHVRNLDKCISELRRVCSERLIIVVPKQRPYRYTFDLHLHFFPYKFSVMQIFNNKNGVCIELSNDWLYTEDFN